MRIVPEFIVHFFIKESDLYKELQSMLGFTPGNITLYESALCHRSNNKNISENNERLEYLGDAILGAVISEFLFIKYPARDEGYLTDMRSKIVNRKNLNQIGLDIGLKLLMKFNEQDIQLRESYIFGNALEALIGAIYIDKGFAKTKTFIRKKILIPFVNMNMLENIEINSKNKLIGWAAKHGKTIEFALLDETGGASKNFLIGVKIDNEIISKSSARTKKEASKLAANEAIKILNII
ncbi:MAG TPA: ribonuclease III [Chitinophagaceae bacterium]|nr:MAG: ribonuclease III [Bacteroidetes bacterium OLB11]HMN33697.1 ribonuclease III [Chitinophagaceae bacterium]